MKTTRHTRPAFPSLKKRKIDDKNLVVVNDKLLCTINGKEIFAVTAIDFRKNAVSYVDLETNEEKTIIGSPILFVDKGKLQKRSDVLVLTLFMRLVTQLVVSFHNTGKGKSWGHIP